MVKKSSIKKKASSTAKRVSSTNVHSNLVESSTPNYGYNQDNDSMTQTHVKSDSAKNIVLASRFLRFIAFLVDTLILSIILFPITEKLDVPLNWDTIIGDLSNLDPSIYYLSLIYSILVFVYFFCFEYFMGKTPGKMIFKFKVISIKDGVKSKMLFWQAAVRSLFLISAPVLSIISFIDPFFIFSSSRQRLLEKLSFTCVIKEDEVL